MPRKMRIVIAKRRKKLNPKMKMATKLLSSTNSSVVIMKS